MKLNVIAAAALSLASLVATAQTFDLTFDGKTNGAFAQNGMFFGGDPGLRGSPFIGGTQILAGANGSPTFLGTATLLPWLPTTTVTGVGALAGYDYGFLFFKVDAPGFPPSGSGTALAGLSTTLTLSNEVGRNYSFLNGLDTLNLNAGSTDNQYWRGFSVVGGSTLNQNQYFGNLVDSTLSSLSVLDTLGPFVTATQPTGQQDQAIFVTVVRATNS